MHDRFTVELYKALDDELNPDNAKLRRELKKRHLALRKRRNTYKKCKVGGRLK